MEKNKNIELNSNNLKSYLKTENLRKLFKLTLMPIFENGISQIDVKTFKAIKLDNKITKLFPDSSKLKPIVLKNSKNKKYTTKKNNVGIIFSGGPAPGGHNVIYGIYNSIKSINNRNNIYGFLNGIDGLLQNRYIKITSKIIYQYKNTGGFEMIGTSRNKIQNINQFKIITKNLIKLNINSLVIIGGDDSNTNACILSEYFMKNKIAINIIGCPKTIDRDLKNKFIETTFGFDTACKTYTHLISNIQKDAISSGKNWHFIQLMGRHASHITLECALQTHPNITLISEEIIAQNKTITLKDIVKYISEIIIKRSKNNMNYGVILIPEGLIEFIPETKELIKDINSKEYIIKNHNINLEEKVIQLKNKITENNAKFYDSLPYEVQKQLISNVDDHGNINISKIEINFILIHLVSTYINNKYKNQKSKININFIKHFFGYEGRCASPSNFDAIYCYNLGYVISSLIYNDKTGYIVCIKNLAEKIEKWIPYGIPIISMLKLEKRNGIEMPVIQKTKVDINDKPYLELKNNRNKWSLQDDYIYQSPIQYYGPNYLCNSISISLLLENQSKHND